MIIPTAEPFFFPGSETGCLLVHGFTGTPKEMRELGEHLAAQGYTVLGVRLTGHATRPADMVRSRWGDWLTSVEDGWHLLRGSTQRVFLLGLSMGGALSLTFAAEHPVAGVVAMSTPYTLPPTSGPRRLMMRLPASARYHLFRLLSLLMPYASKGPSPEPMPDWMRDHISYPQNPTRSAAELDRLLEHMRQTLPRLTAPVLLIHSRGDDYVPPEHMLLIHNLLHNAEAQTQWLEKSGHVITRDVEKAQVFQAATAFIRRNSI